MMGKSVCADPVLQSAQCSATLVGLLRLWDEVPVLRLATSASVRRFLALIFRL